MPILVLKKLWWWLQYGFSRWRALGWHHHRWEYISQRQYNSWKQILSHILYSHWPTYWWCKVQHLIKKNRNCHKYHLSQNHWKGWVLYSFVCYWWWRRKSLTYNIKYTLIVADNGSLILTMPHATILLFCETNIRYFPYKTEATTDQYI